MKILIAGGGIGGLTAALCCLQRGHQVIVLEQAATIAEIGAGIQLPPNAIKVLHKLGLQEQLAELAFRPEALEARMGVSGRNIFSVALSGAAGNHWQAPYLHIHRADYIAVLRNALQTRAPNCLTLDAKITSVTQSGQDVTVSVAGNRHYSGDALIAADGIHSTVRNIIGDDSPAAFTGNIAWRAVVPVEKLGKAKPPPTACVWMGSGRHAVTYLLRGGELANFVGVVERDDWRVESWSARGEMADALQDFKGWHPGIVTLLEQADALSRWALYDRKPLQRWTDGRIALLGDAAHPMLPFMAQGAAMAVEDAWVVAEELSQGDASVSDRLMRYEQRRLARTSRMQAISRANASTFHRHSTAAKILHYTPMWLAGQLVPGLIRKNFDWIYAYNVTGD
ncbi:MAG: FAD-dependent monooxygenase [Pseudomonadales bacterium]